MPQVSYEDRCFSCHKELSYPFYWLKWEVSEIERNNCENTSVVAGNRGWLCEHWEVTSFAVWVKCFGIPALLSPCHVCVHTREGAEPSRAHIQLTSSFKSGALLWYVHGIRCYGLTRKFLNKSKILVFFIL